LQGTVLVYKTIENGAIKQKAKLPNGNVVEIPPQTDLSNYYTKNEIDQFLADISNSLSELQSRFQDYYTIEQINDIISEISNSLSSIKEKFSDYYTKI